jgi:glycosyltransferase involved in cell wall biosynthesis
MKIGIVLPSLPGYSETFFRNKISGLQQHGATVILFVNNPKTKKNYLNARVVNAPRLNGSLMDRGGQVLVQVLKALCIHPRKSRQLYIRNKKEGFSRSENIKSVLTNQFFFSEQVNWLHFGFGTMALGRENIAAVMGAKMAVSFRGYDYYVYPKKHKDCYKLLFSKRVRYHVLSEGMKKGLITQGVSADAIFKITPAIDTAHFSKKKTTNNKQVQITTVARLHWIKGLEHTLEALALLKDTIDFHYTIVGEGPDRERLLFAAHQLGLSERVTFTGTLTPEEVRNQLNTTDVYLQYSIQEGFCNAVLEAQAMGVLCVVSDADGLSENVLDTTTGWVVPKQQPKLLAEKIKEVLAMDESERGVIRQQAKERVRNEFNLEKQQQEFLNFYENQKN